MDYFYSIPMNPDLKHGADLLPSDLEACQLQMLYEDVDNARMLALDESQPFNMAFLEDGAFGTVDDTLSRASTNATPQSECSTRTTFSASTISPQSEMLAYQDPSGHHDKQTPYLNTTQSISSGRQSRTTSASWPPANTTGMGHHSSGSTPPARAMPYRPHSFSRRPHQTSPRNGTLAPNSFYSSPGLHAAAAATATPTTMQNQFSSAQMPQMRTPPNTFIQSRMLGTNPSYLAQPATEQMTNPAHFYQQHALDPHQSQAYRRASQPQISALNSYSPQTRALTRTASQPTNYPGPQPAAAKQMTPTLPNTVGNSSTGYQCFSHGCGGRHFSNWGNLVRHHRERQLRSKAGAKPTCPRCGKGFTRSSARDAHVAGLKCVLGRRRRGAAAASGTASNKDGNDGDSGGSTSLSGSTAPAGDRNGNGAGCEVSENDADADVAPERRKDNSVSDDDHEREQDDHSSEDSRDEHGTSEDDDETAALVAREPSFAAAQTHEDMYYSMDLLGSTGPAYLSPQHLQFDS